MVLSTLRAILVEPKLNSGINPTQFGVTFYVNKMQGLIFSGLLIIRTKAQKKVLLFKHLHQYERELSVTRPYPIVGAHIHPSVLQLGLQVRIEW
jgi:hypothetical protein